MIRSRLIAFLVGVLIVASTGAASAAGPSIKVGNGTAASCTQQSLRTALTLADMQGGGVIYFRCGSRPVTITVTQTTLVVPDNTILDGGGLVTLELPILNDNFFFIPVLTVPEGANAVVTTLGVRGGFYGVDNDGTLTIRNSTIIGAYVSNINNSGTLTLIDSVLSGDFFDLPGGAIFNGGALVVQRCAFLGDDEEFFGIRFGGGIANFGSAVVTDSLFSGLRFEEGNGGAIANWGTMVVRNTKMTNNLATHGGGIWNVGKITVTSSRISGNLAGLGGGIYNEGDAVVTGSVVTDNTAISERGGGVYICCGGRTVLLGTRVTGNTPDNVFSEP